MKRTKRKGGWYGESGRHSKAARGIKTGRKYYKRFNIPKTYNKYSPNISYPISQKKDVRNELIKRAIITGAIHVAPMAREVYIGYTTVKLVYSSWKLINQVFENQDTLKQQAYGIIKDEVKIGLTEYQTGIIWDNIKNRIPEPIEYEAHNQLTNIMSNISEEEILLVEHALSAF